MNNINHEKVEELVLVNPNLGHPRFINMEALLEDNIFQTKLLFISNIEDSKKIELLLKEKLKLIPILEYRWRVKQLIEKRKKKGIWARIKSVFSRIFRRKRVIDEDYKIPPKVIAFRGTPITTEILTAELVVETPIDMPSYLNDEYCHPQDYLIKYQVFGDLNIFYSVKMEFSLSEEVLEFLKRRKFVMFDIIHSNGQSRINYHSLVISRTDWDNFRFIHATDLHLAERNDEMYGLIRHWTRNLRRKNIELLTQVESPNANIDDDKLKKSYSIIDLSYKRRIINPNNLFRQFIKIINRKVLRDKVDFVVITGDLLDFTIMSRLPKELQKSFDYKYSNWQVFKNILLNINQYKRKGIRRTEELLCPIFTVPGNHDYRPWQYDLYLSKIYKKMGLTGQEAIALRGKDFSEILKFSIKSGWKNTLALKAYWSEINPSDDYSLQFGNNLFIFLNSGPDSFRNVKDYIKGHPSVTGLSNKQIKYLENIIRIKYKKGQKVFLCLHGPPINPKKKSSVIRRFKKAFGKKIKTEIHEFKETLLIKDRIERPNARIDDKFNLKIGTISSNIEKLIKFCYDFCILTLSGHTHEVKEFRLETNKNIRNNIDFGSYSIEKEDNPVAVYYDNYSQLYISQKRIQDKAPYIVQTPGLGLKPTKESMQAGAYRVIKIRDGKLASFKIKNIK